MERPPPHDVERGSDVSIVSLLGAASSDGLLRHGRRRDYAAGEAIFARGDPGDTLFVIEAGRVEISRTSLGGRRSVLNQMGPGEILGEIAMLDNLARSADATAATEVTLLCVSRAGFMDFLRNHPDAAMALISGLCARVRQAADMFEDQAQLGARVRLARCLTRIAKKWGAAGEDGSVVLNAPLSQAELGEFSGLARENVNRQMKALENEGILCHVEGAIRIVDPEALAEIAEIWPEAGAG
jgi:CRP/FNR family transcriptional regulator, cyclic AMP receptor protein